MIVNNDNKQEKRKHIPVIKKIEQNRIEQNRIEQNRIEQNRTEQNRIEQNRIEQNRIEQNRIEQNRIEQNRIEQGTKRQDRVQKTIGDYRIEYKYNQSVCESGVHKSQFHKKVRILFVESEVEMDLQKRNRFSTKYLTGKKKRGWG